MTSDTTTGTAVRTSTGQKGEELDDLLTGCVILGAEPVKDGAADAELMLYLKRQNGNMFLLRVSADNEESTLDVFTASLPKEAYS